MAKTAVTKKKKSTVRKKQSMSQRIWVVIAVLLALSMILPSIASLFGGGGAGVGF